ncbi:hypothetical protein [Humibacter ginsengiterrae]
MNGERPAPRPEGVSDQQAVDVCREWMIYLGEFDTMVATGDAALVCDLYSSRYVAFVSNERGNIGMPLVDRAVALVASDGRRGLVFHSGGTRPAAGEFADANGIALIMFDPENGDIEARNQVAVPICREYRLA